MGEDYAANIERAGVGTFGGLTAAEWRELKALRERDAARALVRELVEAGNKMLTAYEKVTFEYARHYADSIGERYDEVYERGCLNDDRAFVKMRDAITFAYHAGYTEEGE